MNQDLKEKKLLVLGAYDTEKEIISEAHLMGVYVIVTDNHENWDDAPAKKVADEAWNISWSDIKTLSKKCIDEHVDGIMAGFSEKRIHCAQLLCEILNKPFYANGAKLDVIIDKILFKQACINSGVTVPKSYKYGDFVEYPVIVKPSDNGGSRGITVCYSQEEFIPAYQKALDASDNKSVVIEQYFVADETMIYFTVHNGIVDVSAMCDRYMHYFGTGITQLPVGYLYPSKHLDVFLKYNLEKFRILISNLGITNGLIAFQSFVVGNEVIPFDPTYRLDGTMTYHICEEISGSNVLNMLIRYSLTGSMGEDATITSMEKPKFKRLGFELPILLRNGLISFIEGLEDVNQLDGIIHIYQGHFVGEMMTKVADFSQILCRIHMVADDINNIKSTIQKIYDLLKVIDENGEDMIICRIDLDKIGK